MAGRLNCSMRTVESLVQHQFLLGWVVDIVNMTLSLTTHSKGRILEILVGIPAAKKRLIVTTWNKLFGELGSMALALPEVQGHFSHMQESLSHINRKRVTLTCGVHEALDYLQWLDNYIDTRPTWLFELFHLNPIIYGYHNASGYMFGVFSS